jgi:hypothetical protein
MNLTKTEAELLASSFGATIPETEGDEVHLITTQSGRAWWLTFWNGEYRLTDEL